MRDRRERRRHCALAQRAPALAAGHAAARQGAPPARQDLRWRGDPEGERAAGVARVFRSTCRRRASTPRRWRFPARSLAIAGDDLCRVVRRRELDARLAFAARDRGVELREDSRVRAVVRDGRGRARRDRERRAFWAPVVVGRRRQRQPGAARAGHDRRRASSVARSCATSRSPGRHGTATRAGATISTSGPSPRGVRGYGWAFPCWIDGAAHVNVGVYALPPASGAALQRELAASSPTSARAPTRWQAFPIRTFVPGAPVAAPHALLVGDAAGCDPLMGEGISYALEYGIMAADAIVAARLQGGDAVRRVRARRAAPARWRASSRRLEWASRRFYGPARGVVVPAGAAQPARAGDRTRLVQRRRRAGTSAARWAALGALVRPGAWQARVSAGGRRPRTVATAAPHLERLLWRVGIRHVAGVDEVGMGPLAGPVVAAAVVLPVETHIDGVADSKVLSAAVRELLAAEIRRRALARRHRGRRARGDRPREHLPGGAARAPPRGRAAATAGAGLRPRRRAGDPRSRHPAERLSQGRCVRHQHRGGVDRRQVSPRRAHARARRDLSGVRLRAAHGLRHARPPARAPRRTVRRPCTGARSRPCWPRSAAPAQPQLELVRLAPR